MQDSGLSGRALASALHVSNATVSGWLHGADPHAEQKRTLADYFGITVEELFGPEPLRTPYPQNNPTVADANRHLVQAPLRTAAAAADRSGGAQDERQLTFERYVKQIHELREQAEKLAAGDVTKAVPIFDELLATWLAQREAKPARRGRKKSDLVRITPKTEDQQPLPTPSRRPRTA